MNPTDLQKLINGLCGALVFCTGMVCIAWIIVTAISN